MTTDRDDRTAQAAAYAVDATTDADRDEIDARRATDPALDAEIGEFAETAALLGLAVAPVTPPVALRASLLAAIDADLAANPVPVEQPVDAPTADPGGERATVTPIRAWHRRPAILIAAIAAAGALLFGGTAIGIGLASGSGQVSEVDQVLQAQDAQRITAAVDGGGTATWVWSQALQRSVVQLDDLPELATGLTYQFWYIDDSGAAPSNTFAGGSHQVAVAGEMPPGATLGVTVEPAGGSTEPSTDPILLIASA